MLVLSRKQQQTFLIGDQIEVKILKIRGNTVRIGISAPDDVKIMRGEISPFGLEKELELTIDSEETGADQGRSEAPLANKLKSRATSVSRIAESQTGPVSIAGELTQVDGLVCSRAS